MGQVRFLGVGRDLCAGAVLGHLAQHPERARAALLGSGRRPKRVGLQVLLRVVTRIDALLCGLRHGREREKEDVLHIFDRTNLMAGLSLASLTCASLTYTSPQLDNL